MSLEHLKVPKTKQVEKGEGEAEGETPPIKELCQRNTGASFESF